MPFDNLANDVADGPLAERSDGLQNVFTGMGTARDRTTATRPNIAARMLGQRELENLYMSGIPRRFVDDIPDDILRHPTTITIADAANSTENINVFEQYLQAIGFHRALAEVIRLQRLYGGAVLVYLIDDGQEWDQPLDPTRVRRIEGFMPLANTEINPHETEGVWDLAKPELYRVSSTQRVGPGSETLTELVIHHTRLARFDGLYLPWHVRKENRGWGQSCVQLIYEAYKRWETAMAGLETMVGDSDLFVHKIPGLFNKIAQGQEDAIAKRLELNRMSRSVYGGMAIDLEEEVNFLTRALSNLTQATEPFMQELQAATGWPSSILMGMSPGGLGKEGRFEERVWATLVERWQLNYCKSPITECFSMLMLAPAGPFRGRAPGQWAVEFPSTFTQTAEEKAELQLKYSQVDSTYINLGVLNPLEIRQSRFSGTDYGENIDLDESISRVMQDQQAMQFDMNMLGMQAQAEAYLQGPEAAEPQQGEQQQQPPPKAEKKDAAEIYRIDGIHIHVTHQLNKAKLGYVVYPDGQRVDNPEADRLILAGPDQRRTNLYEIRYEKDGESKIGPHVIGFTTLKAARDVATQVFPAYGKITLSKLSSAKAAEYKMDWGSY